MWVLGCPCRLLFLCSQKLLLLPLILGLRMICRGGERKGQEAARSSKRQRFNTTLSARQKAPSKGDESACVSGRGLLIDQLEEVINTALDLNLKPLVERLGLIELELKQTGVLRRWSLQARGLSSSGTLTMTQSEKLEQRVVPEVQTACRTSVIHQIPGCSQLEGESRGLSANNGSNGGPDQQILKDPCIPAFGGLDIAPATGRRF
ncbi:hypothetical protein NDU88_000811 [Pleurodeles waltl]|uniref:Uncharacterized protein n=1 Tax=Pleurodeles waltl TaxID=8319 RepID=A0AAV7WGK1_PLEWA|nr:hypothetical protein NDU88_000811 [Pleurodeles waltl]